MDISRVAPTAAPKAAGKSSGSARAPGGPDFRSMLDVEESDEAAPARPVTGPAGLGSLLLAQESGDALENRRRNRQRGNQLLDRLEDLRMGLLEGRLPESQIHALMNLVKQQRAQMDDDAGLSAILDEIELRAAVELAKLGQA